MALAARCVTFVHEKVLYPVGGRAQEGGIAMKKIAIVLMILIWVVPAHAAWDFSKHSIPVDDIQSGGPPKDGIPALFNPEYLTASDADKLLTSEDRVLGFVSGGKARAYPIRIMSWHELVNDSLNGIPYLVSW